MHRFYLPSQITKEKTLNITESRIVHQLSKVLRMRTGDRLHIFGNNKKEVIAEILDIQKRQIKVQILEEIKNKTEPKIEVSLYQAIPKKPALFELVVQKATEIGVSHIYPLITERTENRRIPKFDRLFTIAMEATEQSGRIYIPEIHHPVNLKEVAKKIKNGYIGYEYEKRKYLSDYNFSNTKEAQIIIGPEGGFTNKEVDLCKKAKIKSFTFGPRILRTETAAISALSLVLLGRN